MTQGIEYEVDQISKAGFRSNQYLPSKICLVANADDDPFGGGQT